MVSDMATESYMRVTASTQLKGHAVMEAEEETQGKAVAETELDMETQQVMALAMDAATAMVTAMGKERSTGSITAKAAATVAAATTKRDLGHRGLDNTARARRTCGLNGSGVAVETPAPARAGPVNWATKTPSGKPDLGHPNSRQQKGQP